MCLFNATISHTLDDGGRRRGGARGGIILGVASRVPFASQRQLNPIIPSPALPFGGFRKILSVNCEDLK